MGFPVTCWLMDAGQKVSQFTRCHGSTEVSTTALDDRQTHGFSADAGGQRSSKRVGEMFCSVTC